MKHSTSETRTKTATAAILSICLTAAACTGDEAVPADSAASAPPPAAAVKTEAPAEAPETGDVVGGEKVLKPIVKGMINDSIFAYTGTGPLTAMGVDTLKLAKGFLRSQVTAPNGELITIVWYRNTPGKLSDPVYRSLNTPIVLGELRVKGWGWGYYDSVADSLKLPKITQ